MPQAERSANPTQGIPPSKDKGTAVAWSLIFVNVTVFFLQGFVHVFTSQAEAYFEKGYLTWSRLLLGDYQTLISHIFLHRDFGHLGINMLFLFLFGRRVERTLGGIHVFLLFMAGAVIGGFFQAWIFPRGVILGSSGGVLALTGAFLMIRGERNLWPLPIKARHAALWLAAWFALQSIVTFGFNATHLSSVVSGHVTHLVGILLGCVYAICMGYGISGHSPLTPGSGSPGQEREERWRKHLGKGKIVDAKILREEKHGEETS